jgi:hypothetical protein
MEVVLAQFSPQRTYCLLALLASPRQQANFLLDPQPQRPISAWLFLAEPPHLQL